MINQFEQKGYKEAEADLRMKMGVWLSTNEKNYPEVYAQYNKALELYRQTKNEVKEIQALLAIASMHLKDGKLDQTKAELKEIIRRYRLIRYTLLHYGYNYLSTIYRLKGSLKESLQYAILCIRSMEQTHGTLSKANFYADLARIYLEIGDRQKSSNAYAKALGSWRNEALSTFAMYYAAGFVVRHLLENGRINEALQLMSGLAAQIPPLTQLQKGAVAQNLAYYCYDALGEYKKAESHYLEAAEWYRKTGNDFEVTQKIRFDIGRFYWKNGKLSQAAGYLEQALAHSPQKNQLATIRDIELMLFSIDSAKGDFSSAIHHLRQHKILSDSLLSEVKTKQIQKLEINYETAQKEQDIRQLQTQNKAQQSELRAASFMRTFILIGLGLLLVILFLVVYQYRIKQRNSREMQRKNEALHHLVQEKEWLVREIHHRVKNNLQIIISLFNAQAEFADHPAVVKVIKEGQERMQAVLEAAKTTNPYGFIVKPFRGRDLLVTLDIARYRHQSNKQFEAASPNEISTSKPAETITATKRSEIKTDAFVNFIGASAPMLQVYKLIEQVAPFDSSVLLLGESGTGKEVAASCIVQLSNRRNKPFIKINCAAIPSGLMEAELFGYEKGAFTGAYEKKTGKFELANGGTILLDEIGEMPLEMQAKLLRVLQEKEFDRIGGKSPVRTNVRIIAATNRNLEKEVAEGRFRDDLYYRLNVFPILLPALRDRQEDIPLLAVRFINQISRKCGKNGVHLSAHALQQLIAYDWPGNVRELEHLMERTILLTNESTIKEVALPSPGTKADLYGKGIANIKTIHEIEREYILSVLKKTSGKIHGPGGAAQLLKLPVTTLSSKIKKLGIKKRHE